MLEKKYKHSNPFEFMKSEGLTLWKGQTIILKSFLKESNVIVSGPRRVGFTTLLASYVIWKMFNEDNFKINFITKNHTHVQNMIRNKLRKALYTNYTKLNFTCEEIYKIKLNNGSEISPPPSSQPKIDIHCDVIIIDNAAHYKEVEKITTQTILFGAKLFMVSSPKKGSFFNRSILNEKKDFLFKKISLRWDAVDGQKYSDIKKIKTKLDKKCYEEEFLGVVR